MPFGATGVLRGRAVEQGDGRPLLGGVHRKDAVAVAQPGPGLVLEVGGRGPQAVAHDPGPLEHVGRGRHGLVGGHGSGWRHGQPGRRQGGLARHPGGVVRSRQGGGGDGRAVARVEGRGDVRRGAAQLGGDVRGRPAVDALGGEPSGRGLLEDESGRGGEPHPLPRGAQAVQPRQPGQEEVDGPVGVAQPQQHAQAGRHRARGLGVVLGQVPRPPERRRPPRRRRRGRAAARRRSTGTAAARRRR